MTIVKHQPGLRFPVKKQGCTCTARCGDCPGIANGTHQACPALVEAWDEARLHAAASDILDALRAATAFVELYTANGVKEQPPKWAEMLDATKIATHCRNIIAQATRSAP